MSVICPTITPLTDDPHEFREQIERIAPFASRVQIDLMDGEFAPTRSISLAQVWWPETFEMVDIHLMFKRPLEHIETIVSLHPDLIIIHAEAEGDLKAFIDHMHTCGIKVGIALLQGTSVSSAAELLAKADHALIFSGHLGYFGGEVDVAQLDKVAEIKSYNPDIEIGWDGGANESNVRQLADGGIDVINVGGAIQRADDSAAVYSRLVSLL